MVQEKNFSIMCSEVLEILKYCPKRDINKIPEKMIMLLNNNKDINHRVEIDPNKSIFDQLIIEETIVMIFIIFRNYWASQEENEEIDKILNENEIKFNDFYAYDKIFNQDKRKEKSFLEHTEEKETISKDQSSKKPLAIQNIINKSNNSKDNNTALIEYKKSFITKFINIIKNFFKR